MNLKPSVWSESITKNNPIMRRLKKKQKNYGKVNLHRYYNLIYVGLKKYLF